MTKLGEWWRWRHVPTRMRKVFDYAIAESYPHLCLGVYKGKQQLTAGFFLGYTPHHVMLQTPGGLKYIPFKKFNMDRVEAERIVEDIEKWADSPEQARYHTLQSLAEKAIHHPHYQVFGTNMPPEFDVRPPVLAHEEGTWYSPSLLPKDSKFYQKPMHRRCNWFLVHCRVNTNDRLFAFFADQITIRPKGKP